MVATCRSAPTRASIQRTAAGLAALPTAPIDHLPATGTPGQYTGVRHGHDRSRARRSGQHPGRRRGTDERPPADRSAAPGMHTVESPSVRRCLSDGDVLHRHRSSLRRRRRRSPATRRRPLPPRVGYVAARHGHDHRRRRLVAGRLDRYRIGDPEVHDRQRVPAPRCVVNAQGVSTVEYSRSTPTGSRARHGSIQVEFDSVASADHPRRRRRPAPRTRSVRWSTPPTAARMPPAPPASLLSMAARAPRPPVRRSTPQPQGPSRSPSPPRTSPETRPRSRAATRWSPASCRCRAAPSPRSPAVC